MRILVVGDSYCSGGSLMSAAAFQALAREHQVDVADVVDEAWTPQTPSERGLREYLGSPHQVIELLDGHEVLVVQGAPVTDAVLDAAPLRLICVARGGPVNVDLAAATARGIPVVTTPGKNARAVAELTIALLVMLARNVADAMRFVDAGNEFGVDNYEGVRWIGHDLEGQRLGLVGLGQVGRLVGGLAGHLGMQVSAYDPFVSEHDMGELDVRPGTLQEVLGDADHVSLHARLTPESRGLIDAARFGQMRPRACLVNTARAELVDETALIDALASGHLAGAALDVATPPAESGRHPLLAYRNVIILPHIGGATHETMIRGGRMAAQEIERFAAGEALLNVANREVLAGAAVPR